MDLTYYKCSSCGNKLSATDAQKIQYKCPLCGNPLEKGQGSRSAYYLNSVSYPEFDIQKCTKCGMCKKVCPSHAITMKPYPVIERDKCTICKLCAYNCPEKAVN
jgi:formate hydrogenlyase subunit 6/NADH:ubiquinone oxidoreductase subunit I